MGSARIALPSMALAIAVCGGGGGRAWALDKQAPAHRGGGAEGSGGFGLAGEVFFGLLPYNPTYAARPDNSGRALFRAGGHLDVDLLGPRLFIPIDVNVFTDRTHQPLRPSEIDLIAGLASAWELPVGRGELGARGEVDAPADGRGASQFYGDVRARYMLSLSALRPGVTAALGGGDVSASVTLGWFAWNRGYFARPDNTGLALLRYAARVEVGVGPRVGVFVDTTFFTDRTVNAVRPSELDLTVGAVATVGDWRVTAAYERDLPTDGRGTGLVQHMAMLLGARTFAWRRGA